MRTFTMHLTVEINDPRALYAQARLLMLKDDPNQDSLRDKLSAAGVPEDEMRVLSVEEKLAALGTPENPDIEECLTIVYFDCSPDAAGTCGSQFWLEDETSSPSDA